MLKTKTTNRKVRNAFPMVIAVDYCGAQYLLKGREPYWYNAGVYGWNWDGYLLGNSVVVVTGYRNLIGYSNYDITNKYEKQAEKIWNDFDLDYVQKTEKVETLVKKWVSEMIEETTK